MAEVARLEGAAAEWLASRRDELNARFVAARRRSPNLDVETVGAWLRRLLPPLADGSPASGELLAAVYELVLLHVGRGRLGAADGAPATPLAGLLVEAFPALGERLAVRPRALVGALSNAVENLGGRAWAFVRSLVEVVRDTGTPEELLDAAALLAWRAGEARLRVSVLARARGLPAMSVLRALGVGDYPAAAASILCASLEADAWIPPTEVFRETTLKALPELALDARERLLRRVRGRGEAVAKTWHVAASLGNFVGFGGEFDDPPICLVGGSGASRHRFHVLSTGGVFVLEADAFGGSCRADADGAVELKTAEPCSLPVAMNTTSALVLPDLVAYTTADSFRLRVAVPERERL
jgi:hypothetical protein